jgi:hypothetical protein
MDSILIALSNSKLFAGAIMLLTNIGGKYLALEIPQNIDQLFTNYFIFRYLVIFAIFFMATRDIKVSILLSLVFFILLRFFINENSSFSLIKNEKKITKDDFLRAKEIVKKYTQKMENEGK